MQGGTSYSDDPYISVQDSILGSIDETLLHGFVKNQKVRRATTFNAGSTQISSKSNTNVMSVTTIKTLAQAKELSKANMMYEQMKEQGVPVSTVIYNSLVDACAKVGDMNRAAQLLEDMFLANIQPDLITFSTIIKGYSIQGNVEKGLQLLQLMRKRGIEADGILYNSLLDGCVKAGRTELCSKLWNDMQTIGIKPSNFTLTILIKLYGRLGLLEKAFQLLETMPKQYGFNTNAHVFTCLMSACITNGQCELAHSVFLNMLQNKITADKKTYETIIYGCAKGELLHKAVSILFDVWKIETQENHDDKTPILELRTYKLLVKKLQQNPSVVEAFGSPLIEGLRKRGFILDPNRITTRSPFREVTTGRKQTRCRGRGESGSSPSSSEHVKQEKNTLLSTKKDFFVTDSSTTTSSNYLASNYRETPTINHPINNFSATNFVSGNARSPFPNGESIWKLGGAQVQDLTHTDTQENTPGLINGGVPKPPTQKDYDTSLLPGNVFVPEFREQGVSYSQNLVESTISTGDCFSAHHYGCTPYSSTKKCNKENYSSDGSLATESGQYADCRLSSESDCHNNLVCVSGESLFYNTTVSWKHKYQAGLEYESNEIYCGTNNDAIEWHEFSDMRTLAPDRQSIARSFSDSSTLHDGGVTLRAVCTQSYQGLETLFSFPRIIPPISVESNDQYFQTK